MSDPEPHLVAVGARVAEALPLVDALLAQSDPRRKVTVEITVAGGSSVVPAYRAPGVVANYELHIPAAHVDEYVAALDPGLVGERAVDDGAGGWWLSVHGGEDAVLDALGGLPEVPVEITLVDVPQADLRLPVEADPVRAGVEWTAWWPPVPELGLGPHLKHAAVWLFVNSTGLWDLEPDKPGYRLYVVTGQRDAARAAHLAGSAGLTILD